MAKKKLNTSSMISDASSIIEPAQDSSKPPSGAPEKRKREATEQLNVRVTEGLGVDMKMWALAHQINPADVIEQGFELMKAKYGA
jgi:hypothetical protein